MPEGDRFEKAFRRGWRGAYRLARGGVAPPAEVADKLLTALAKTLRETGGVPGLGEMGEVVSNAAWRLTLQSVSVGEDAAILIDSFNALGRIIRDKGGHRNTKVAVEVAKSRLVQQGPQANSHDTQPMMKRLVEDVCTTLVGHYFFAIARENLVAESKFEHHDQARGWQDEVERAMQPGIRQTAERLVKNPGAKGLRAPNRTVKRPPTAELLGEVLIPEETPRRSPGRRGS